MLKRMTIEEAVGLVKDGDTITVHPDGSVDVAR